MLKLGFVYLTTIKSNDKIYNIRAYLLVTNDMLFFFVLTLYHKFFMR